MVRDIQDCARGVAVDEFYAKDFGLGEGGGDVDGDVLGLGLAFWVGGYVVGKFFDLFDLDEYLACSRGLRYPGTAYLETFGYLCDCAQYLQCRKSERGEF